MNKSLTLVLVAIAAVVVASGCTSNGSNQGPETGDESTSEPSDTEVEPDATVYYTSSGFTPSTVTIEQGDTVRWINNASGAMWVGSNQHPYHTEYAGSSIREHCRGGDQTSAAFDQCSPGESFSFTFERTGTWGYHNHRNTRYEGTVVVE